MLGTAVRRVSVKPYHRVHQLHLLLELSQIRQQWFTRVLSRLSCQCRYLRCQLNPHHNLCTHPLQLVCQLRILPQHVLFQRRQLRVVRTAVSNTPSSPTYYGLLCATDMAATQLNAWGNAETRPDIVVDLGDGMGSSAAAEEIGDISAVLSPASSAPQPTSWTESYSERAAVCLARPSNVHV